MQYDNLRSTAEDLGLNESQTKYKARVMLYKKGQISSRMY